MTWHSTIVDSRPVLFTTASLPDDLLGRISHQRSDRTTVAIHDFHTWRELRLAGQTVPHPIKHYSYPGPWTPRHNQIVTAEFLATHHRAMCGNGMRTGKTLAALWAADHLMEQDVLDQVLIVAPLSTLETVWERTIVQTFGHRRSMTLLKGTRKQKQRLAAKRSSFLVVNPESLYLIAEHVNPDLVIVDEATSMKNPKSRRWKALASIVGATKPLWLMTAKPTPQSPLDAYGLIRLLRPTYMSFQHWRGLTMYQVTKFKWLPVTNAEQVVAKYLQPAIRFSLDDCGDVPTIQKEYLPIAMSKEQERLTKALLDKAYADFEDGVEITAANAGALLSKLLQVAGGGVYVTVEGERTSRTVPAEPFWTAVEDYVEAADTPVVIFAPFRGVAALAASRLDVPLIWGDTKPAERRRVIDEFQAGRLPALVAVPETMSHGITLDRANYVLWLLPPFKAETYAQACGRVLRAESTKHIVISHLVTSKVANRRYLALESKERLQDTVLDLLTNRSDHED